MRGSMIEMLFFDSVVGGRQALVDAGAPEVLDLLPRQSARTGTVPY